MTFTSYLHKVQSTSRIYNQVLQISAISIQKSKSFLKKPG